MGGSDIWLEEGEAMSVDDLIKATVIMSANDAPWCWRRLWQAARRPLWPK